MPTFNGAVAASADDGQWYGSTFDSAAPAMRAGDFSGASASLFARINNVLINGTITSAVLRLGANGNQNNTVPLRIYAVKEANPTAPTSISDANGRSVTTAHVDWTPGTWTGGQYYSTPDLSAIIQELVDEFEYTGSQSILLYVRDNGATGGAFRNVRTFEFSSGSLKPDIEIQFEPSNAPPTVTPETADEAELSTLAQLEFTGTDEEEDDIRYRVQVSDNPSFVGGINPTSELLSGSGTVIHPNPAGGLTWEGYQQVDDRLGMSFQGQGGVLDSVRFNFGPHESLPANTNGHYLARVYEAEGYPVNPVPPAWTASTSYSAGDIVRPTSTANANVHFVYRCKVGGTSASSEPSWPGNGGNWQSVTPLGETSDGSVTWETLPGMHPVNPADESETPTPGWLAQSVVYPYAPGAADGGWKTLEFEGENRIRLEAGRWYMVILDWRPVNSDNNNTLAILNASLANATSPGSLYLDGPGNNNGPRIIDDAWHVIREESILIDATSGTDDGFSNTEDGADTDPFASGARIRYTVQAGDELEEATHYWRVRVSDPGGSTAWSDWTAVRSFGVSIASGEVLSLSATMTAQSETAVATSVVVRSVSAALPAQSDTAASLVAGRVLSASAIGQSDTATPPLPVARQLLSAALTQSITGEAELLLTAVFRLVAAMLAGSEAGGGRLAASRSLAMAVDGQSSTSGAMFASRRIQSEPEASSSTGTPVLGLTTVINLAVALLAQSETADARLMVAHSLAAQIETEGETAVSRLVVARSPVVALSAQSETEEQSLAVARLLATALLATSASNQPALVLADIVGLVHAVFSSARPGASFSSRRN